MTAKHRGRSSNSPTTLRSPTAFGRRLNCCPEARIEDQGLRIEVISEIQRTACLAESDGSCCRSLRDFPYFSRERGVWPASQVRRAAVSVPANVAEGHGRKSTGAYIHHVSIANGSLMEVETLIQIAHRLDYIDAQRLDQTLVRTDEIGKMLSGLQRSLNPQSSILNPAS
ncbi:MAG: four helix bundle protein [Burkholderiales bacterium]